LKLLQRTPEIVWRVEKRREAETLAALERGEDVAERGTVILIISGMMHQLNLVGGMIWTRCDGSRSEEQIVAELAEEFAVEGSVLAEDVHDFIADLLRRGWLTHD
jgi:pyrroloquinoline quinone biosynthesis protein D